MYEYSNYVQAFAAMVGCGELCRDGECRGWHLSEVDTWHRCGGADCGGADAGHPEAAEEPEDAARFDAMQDEADNRFDAMRDDGIPF